MGQLNKSTVGLGKVANRLQSDGNDISIIMERLDSLNMNHYIEGNWTTILDNSKVNYIPTDNVFDINLDNNLGVAITVNEDSKVIRLSGGLNGRSYYFNFKNLESYMVYWDNVRATDGEAPALVPGTSTDPKITTMVLCKVGNEYYITDVNLNVY